jgi:DNA-binding response OmpR family regulator
MPADQRVLLLDIHAAERGRLTALLSRLDYIAVIAEDAAAAQAHLQRESFPTVIIDMPDRQAQIAELHAQMPGSSIITIGARTLAAGLEAWYAGADGYVPRPLRQKELANALEHVLLTRAAKLDEAQSQRSNSTEFRHLAAELAHQINMPLTMILGMADLLVEELPPNHPGQAYAQPISAAAIRIRDIAWMLADIAQQSGIG